jgi:diacylglycerol kinase family enzyme
VACDIGVANSRRFLAVAGVGFDAECVSRMSRERRGHITHLDYFWPIWRTFWSHRFPRLTVEVDDRLIFEGHGFALIGNLRRYAMGLRILADARCDDGLLDVCVFRCATRRALMAHALWVSLGRHVRHRDVEYRRGRHVLITSPDQVQIEIDGDMAGNLPLDCTILPSATSFLRAGRSGRKKANGGY